MSNGKTPLKVRIPGKPNGKKEEKKDNNNHFDLSKLPDNNVFNAFNETKLPDNTFNETNLPNNDFNNVFNPAKLPNNNLDEYNFSNLPKLPDNITDSHRSYKSSSSADIFNLKIPIFPEYITDETLYEKEEEKEYYLSNFNPSVVVVDEKDLPFYNNNVNKQNINNEIIYEEINYRLEQLTDKKIDEINEYINSYFNNALKKKGHEIMIKLNNMEKEFLEEKEGKLEKRLNEIINIADNSFKKLSENYLTAFTKKIEYISGEIADKTERKLKAAKDNIDKGLNIIAENCIDNYIKKIEFSNNKAEKEYQLSINNNYEQFSETYKNNLRKSFVTISNEEIKKTLTKLSKDIANLDNNNNNNNNNNNRLIEDAIQERLPSFEVKTPHSKHVKRNAIPANINLADELIGDFIKKYHNGHKAINLINEIEKFKIKQDENFTIIDEIVKKETENNNKELFSVTLKNIPSTIIITNINANKLKITDNEKCKLIFLDKKQKDDDYIIRFTRKNEDVADILYQVYMSDKLFINDYKTAENEKKEIDSIILLYQLYVKYNCDFNYYEDYFINNNKIFENHSILSMIDFLYDMSYKKVKNLELYKEDTIKNEESFRELKDELKRDIIVIVFESLKKYLIERDQVYYLDIKGNVIKIIST